MKKILLTAALLASFLSPAHASAPDQSAPAAAAEQARIPFANFRGIRSFHADGNEVVYLQDRRRNWYRADLIGPCFALPWARAVGVDTGGSSVFDRFSTLVVEGERCRMSSLVRSAKPERRASRRG